MARRSTEREERREKRRSASERLWTEVAFLGALLFHLVFLYAFKMHPTVGKQVEAEPAPECILVSPLSELSPDSESAAWEREIHSWCFLADPTLLCLPNDQHGFSRTRRDERVLPVTPIPPFEFAVELSDERVLPELALSSDLPGLPEEMSGKWACARPPLPPAEPGPQFPRHIVWRRTDGTVLTGVPQLDEARIQKALAAGGVPDGATLVDIERSGEPGSEEPTGRIFVREAEFSRVHVRRSSGNLQLDGLLVGVLRERLFHLERHPADEDTLQDGGWMPKAGQRSTFEVDWRLLPALRRASEGET